MQSCETCRHWDQSQRDDRTDERATCLAAGQDNGIDALASIGTEGMDLGALFTRADFGCVCHEPKGE